MTSSTRIFLLLILLALAFGAFPHTARNFESSNELSSLYLATAVTDYRSISINPVIQRWGDIADKSRRGEIFYSDKAPGMAFVTIVPATALKLFSFATAVKLNRDQALIFARMIAIIFPCLFIILYFNTILKAFTNDDETATALTIAYALGTPVWVYSTLLYGHQLSAASLFIAFMLLRNSGNSVDATSSSRQIKHSVPGIAAPGLLLGLAIAFDYSAIWGAACIIFYAILRGYSKKGWFWLGLAISLVALCAYHWTAFGGPLKTGYSFKVYARDAAVHARGILGIGLPSLSSLAGILVSPRRGLFYCAPWLLLAIPGFVRMARRKEMRADLILCASLVLGHTILIGSFSDWTAGWSYGPRHLVPMLPFLLIPLAVEIGAAGRIERLVFGMLLGISIAATALAVVTFPHVPVQLENPITGLFLPLVKAGDVGPLIFGLGHKAALVLIIVIALATLAWISVEVGKRFGTVWIAGIFAAGVVAPALWLFYANSLPRQEGTDKHFAMSQVYGAMGDHNNAVAELMPLTARTQTLDMRLFASFTLWKMFESANEMEQALTWRRVYLGLLDAKKGKPPTPRFP